MSNEIQNEAIESKSTTETAEVVLSTYARQLLDSNSHKRVLNMFSISISNINEADIHYTNVEMLKQFLTSGNRIIKTRFVEIKSPKQKRTFDRIVECIKIARIMGLLSYPGQKAIAQFNTKKRFSK